MFDGSLVTFFYTRPCCCGGCNWPYGTSEKPSGVPVFAWKEETLEEYWWATEQLFRWPDGKGLI
ncbi:MAG: hypothetical protein CM15mP49_10750 [Actinomycetota bacterium]|nr:MAG: hypothetical protein CM15mP49_10750 [Actinomycetota bacterium]